MYLSAVYYDYFDLCNSDIDNDLICDELEILGCQDSLALNYESSATNAGVCDYLGCTNSLYIEFNPIATIDDQSCEILIVYGCTDSNACNYNSLANVDDSSCYDIFYGCMDSLAFNFNDCDFDGYPNSLTGIPGVDVNTAIDDCDFYGCMPNLVLKIMIHLLILMRLIVLIFQILVFMFKFLVVLILLLVILFP